MKENNREVIQDNEMLKQDIKLVDGKNILTNFWFSTENVTFKISSGNSSISHKFIMKRKEFANEINKIINKKSNEGKVTKDKWREGFLRIKGE